MTKRQLFQVLVSTVRLQKGIEDITDSHMEHRVLSFKGQVHKNELTYQSETKVEKKIWERSKHVVDKPCLTLHSNFRITFSL